VRKLTFIKDGKTLEVTVGPDSVTLETKGYSGTSCLDATRSIEERLGTVTATDHTPEMYDRESTCQVLDG